MTTTVVDRSQFLGGSDISGVLGLSRYETPLSIWSKKTGQIPETEKTMRMRVGTKMEDVIADLWMEETGKTLHRVVERRSHPKFPHFRCQIDRIVVGENATWEGKNTNWRLRKDWDNDAAPTEALCQAQWGLAITGKPYCYIAGLIENSELKSVKVDRDPVMIAEMLKRANAFWNDFVIPKVMPMQITAQDTDILSRLFPNAEPETQIDLGDDAAKLIENRNASIQDIKQIEKNVEQIENMLKAMMQTNEAAKAGKYKMLWYNQHRKAYSVDAKDVRVFRVKESKDGNLETR